MGIATSNGIIRDFAGPYTVSEDQMAFGRPMKYVVMDPFLARGGADGWDRAVFEASEEYKTRMVGWSLAFWHFNRPSIPVYFGDSTYLVLYILLQCLYYLHICIFFIETGFRSCHIIYI